MKLIQYNIESNELIAMCLYFYFGKVIRYSICVEKVVNY